MPGRSSSDRLLSFASARHRVRRDGGDLPAHGAAWLAERQAPADRRPVLRLYVSWPCVVARPRRACSSTVGRGVYSAPMLTEKGDQVTATRDRRPTSRRLHRRLVPGQVHASVRGATARDDARLPVRHGHVRGHPRLLERGAGAALRAEAARALQAHGALGQGAADEAADAARGAGRPDGRPAAPQRLPPGRLHPADALQVERDHRRPPAQPRAATC